MQIYAFGDSITWGSWDPQGGWADRLKHYYLEQGEETKVYNLGIPGECSDSLATRLLPELQTRASRNESLVLIVAIGANDAAFHAERHAFVIPPEEFQKNLTQMVNEAEPLTSRILLLAITPVNESAPSLNAGSKVRTNAYIQRYNDIIAQVAKEQGVQYLDLFQPFQDAAEHLLDEDGLHPNAQGHSLIFTLVKEALLT